MALGTLAEISFSMRKRSSAAGQNPDIASRTTRCLLWLARGILANINAPPAERPAYASTTMCNLYSITTNQAAIINLFRVINRYVGNLAPTPDVFPDYSAPVIRNTDAGTEMTLMRDGLRLFLPSAWHRHQSPVAAHVT